MNKTELVSAVAEKTEMTKRDADAAVTAIFEVITAALSRDERVQIVGFGSFETKRRAERTGRNPRTKETIVIPATKTPVFKPGKQLKDMVAD